MQERGQVCLRNPDRVANAPVPQLAAVDQPVHCRRAHAKLLGHVTDGEPRHSPGDELRTSQRALSTWLRSFCAPHMPCDALGLYWGFASANPAKPGERASGLGSPIVRSSEVCHPVRAAAELPVRIPKLRVAGSNPVSRSIPRTRESWSFRSGASVELRLRVVMEPLVAASQQPARFVVRGARRYDLRGKRCVGSPSQPVGVAIA